MLYGGHDNLSSISNVLGSHASTSQWADGLKAKDESCWSVDILVADLNVKIHVSALLQTTANVVNTHNTGMGAGIIINQCIGSMCAIRRRLTWESWVGNVLELPGFPQPDLLGRTILPEVVGQIIQLVQHASKCSKALWKPAIQKGQDYQSLIDNYDCNVWCTRWRYTEWSWLCDMLSSSLPWSISEIPLENPDMIFFTDASAQILNE